ncbi:hypothetical protein BGZ63DRAFT_346450 [Mariannaea sp. PMI_226]|nr:hypothetical protein BGZ63DRAFT_346450 [Mariannaea sp. PMI_226]
MSSANGKASPAASSGLSVSVERPHFNSQLTSDRLREGFDSATSSFKIGGCIRKGRKSIFKEMGLHEGGDEDVGSLSLSGGSRTQPGKHPSDQNQDERRPAASPEPQRQTFRRYSFPTKTKAWYTKLTHRSRPRIKSTSAAAAPGTGTLLGLQRYTMLAMIIAIMISALSWRSAEAASDPYSVSASSISKRENSPTSVCNRWAFQSAFLNGTTYLYGGRAKTTDDQENGTWNNYFLTLDLTKDWDSDSPSLKGLEIPDGPPKVSMGYLWNDYHSLYLYGGQFSDSPYVEPGPESLWKYAIQDGKWTELKNPKTSSGNYSEAANLPVHRAAEGAGLSIPELGLSWYFGGHLDWATTPGWSRDVDRVYLKSLLEFTHPGYINSGVQKLSSGTGAGQEGAFRNITKGGVQAGSFPERADGALIFVPGWGDMGVLIGLAGGTADNFTHDLQTLDVYDIANSEWFHQETSGDHPGVRVNPCAVVASAPDASSFQIYVFGGQNLPFGNQTQYNDMYILTIPSFTWIKVDQPSQHKPSPRAGHSCTMHDGQLVVIGGFLGEDASCDDPGIYVFNASSLSWDSKFSAADHAIDWHSDNIVLAGSYGYTVPEAVQKVIGGNQEGGATATTPAAGATGGPFATGKPPIYTITQPGATATITHGSSDDGTDSRRQAGLIAAGVIAGVAGILAFYLGFCAWLYRRQVRAYRQHLAVSNRYSGASYDTGSLDPSMSAVPPTNNRWSSRESYFGWVGSDRGGAAYTSSLVEPKWSYGGGDTDDPSPGTSSGAGAATVGKQSEESRLGSGSGSGESTERLLAGQEPSFFSVVMGPRRALRVVNAVE